MARTMFELPNDIISKIFDYKAELEMADRMDLYITNHHDVCYACGCSDVKRQIRFNSITYKFCSFCSDGPLSYTGDTEDFIDYVNEWSCGDANRMEKMYHSVCAPEETDDIWNLFWNISLRDHERSGSLEWVKMLYGRYLEVFALYTQTPPVSPLGNEYAYDWGDSDSEVESDEM